MNGNKTIMDRFIWAMMAAGMGHLTRKYMRAPKRLDQVLVPELFDHFVPSADKNAEAAISTAH